MVLRYAYFIQIPKICLFAFCLLSALVASRLGGAFTGKGLKPYSIIYGCTAAIPTTLTVLNDLPGPPAGSIIQKGLNRFHF